MTNYDRIYKLLEAGKIAEAQAKDWNYVLFSSIMSNWCLKLSGISFDLSFCYDTLWCSDGKQHNINNMNIISIKEYDKAPYIYKPWDMVNISEHVKDIPGYDNWNKACKSIIWWPFEIKKRTMNWDYEVYTKNKMNTSYISWEYLSPYIEPIWPSEEEIAKAIKILEKAWKIKDSRILDI